MDEVAKIVCAPCKKTVIVRARKPDAGEPSLAVTATSIKMPCGHHCSDEKRWSGQVAELSVEEA